MMPALLLYGYAVGVFSSRKLERATFEDVAFRMLAAGEHSHFTTLNEFRLLAPASEPRGEADPYPRAAIDVEPDVLDERAGSRGRHIEHRAGDERDEPDPTNDRAGVAEHARIVIDRRADQVALVLGVAVRAHRVPVSYTHLTLPTN